MLSLLNPLKYLETIHYARIRDVGEINTCELYDDPTDTYFFLVESVRNSKQKQCINYNNGFKIREGHCKIIMHHLMEHVIGASNGDERQWLQFICSSLGVCPRKLSTFLCSSSEASSWFSTN